MTAAWLDDGDVRLYHGDALEVLRGLPDRSVHMCATSPPFFGLRDYGTEGQIGLEETPDQWVERLVAVFREVRRVLRDDGTLWVEIGDSYSSSPPGNVAGVGATSGLHGANDPSGKYRETLKAGHATKRDTSKLAGTKPKDLLGQPWLLAFALRADGWYLRSEIIWARPNPMPESVTDRPTKSHSTVFLLSKSPRYFYDADAIREALATPPHAPGNKGSENWQAVRGASVGKGMSGHLADPGRVWGSEAGANARSVWTIPTEPTPFAHFATWPRKLVARMIQAGTSERGCCPECGAPWTRDVARNAERDNPAESARQRERSHEGPSRGNRGAGGVNGVTLGVTEFVHRETVGWDPGCSCGTDPGDDDAPGVPHAPLPCTVLDPFAGSGTTNLVARHHGRRSIGIELNESYLKIAADRLAQLSLLAEPA